MKTNSNSIYSAPKLRFSITGCGVYKPKFALSSDELDRVHNRPQGQTQREFQLSQRFVASVSETTSFMATEAAHEALSEAGISPADLDAIIGACSVMEQPIPGTAIMVQNKLGIGLSGIAAFDVNATCLSGYLGLDTAAMGMITKGWKRVMVITADSPSVALNHNNPESSALFGDGATAIVLERAENLENDLLWLADHFESFGQYQDLCRLEAGGTRLNPHKNLDDFLARSLFHMEGPALFKASARHFPEFLSRLLAKAGLELKDVDLIIPHQASAPALKHLKKLMPKKSIVDIFNKNGNQVASSLPHALIHAKRNGLIKPGQIIMLIGSSAGISFGGALWQA